MSDCPLGKIRLSALEDIFKASPLAICLIEMPQRHYKWANSRYCDLWGGAINEKTISGLNVTELLTDPNSKALLALEKAHKDNVSTEFDLWSSSSFNGKTTYWSGAIIPVYSHKTGDGDSVTGVLSLLTDVTEKVEAINAAKRNLARIESERTRHQDFLRLVAHEFKTPLTVLQMLAQASIRALQQKSHELLSRHLEGVVRQANLMHRFMVDISGTEPLESFNCDFEAVSFNQFVSNCLHELAYIFNEHIIVSEIPKDCDALISIDKHRLYQVLTNLLTNAIKFSKIGSRISCKVSYTQHTATQHTARFEISDSGPGLPSNILSKIFDRSFRAHQSADISGEGLGLFLSKNIIKTMNGRIWAESSGIECGSTFIIELPVVDILAVC